jgi:hypothetical protein
VLLLAVSDTEPDMKAFIKKYRLTLPVAMAADEIPAAYGIRGVPTVLVIDGDGDIKRTFVGGTTVENLVSIVDDLTQ